MATQYAVKFYKNVDPALNPTGIPDVWPAEVVDLDTEPLPKDPTYVVMDKAAYDQYVIDNQPIFDAYYQPLKQAQDKEEKQLAQAATAISVSQTILKALNVFCQQFDIAMSSQFLSDISIYLAYVNVGLFKLAAVYVSTFQDSQGILDKQADASNPKLGPLRQYLSTLVS